MGDDYGGLSLVDVLTASSARSAGTDVQIAGVNVKLSFGRFLEDSYCDGGGVNAPAFLSRWNSLVPVATGLIPEEVSSTRTADV